MPTSKTKTAWLLYDIPATTKQHVRLYAATNNLTLSAAASEMIDFAFSEYQKLEQANASQGG